MATSDLDTLLQHFSSQPTYNYKILIAASLIYMAAGTLTMTISLTVPVIKLQFDIDSTHLFLLVTLYQVGYMAGGLMTPVLMKKYIRRSVILTSMTVSVIIAACMAAGPPLFFIYVLRLGIGVCNGIYIAQIPCIITEVSSF